MFVRLPAGKGDFQPTIATAFGMGRGWGGIWPFLLAAALGIGFAGAATSRLALSDRSLVAGVIALAAWGLYAILAPTLLGIDHQGLLYIQGAGDATALHKGFPSTESLRHWCWSRSAPDWCCWSWRA